jgi:hypothetical protein
VRIEVDDTIKIAEKSISDLYRNSQSADKARGGYGLATDFCF